MFAAVFAILFGIVNALLVLKINVAKVEAEDEESQNIASELSPAKLQ